MTAHAPAPEAPADLLVVGAGAAGLVGAVAFARLHPGARTVVLDRMPSAGAKLAVTGGGRGNLSRDLPPDGMAAAFGAAARFVAPAFRAFPVRALREFFRGIGVETVVEEGGGIYPASQSAAAVRDALVAAVRRAGAELRLGTAVGRLVPPGEGGGCWTVELAGGGRVFRARRVLLAGGGQSAARLGSDGSGFALARALGHSIVPPVPALAPLVVRESWPGRLAGVSVRGATLSLAAESAAGLPAARACGDLLFTHKGVSGPAALNLSGAVARRLAAGIRPATVRLGVLAEAPDFAALHRTHGARPVLSVLARMLPRALAAELLALAGVPPETPCARLSAIQTRALAETLTALPVAVDSTGSFAESMATAGGVARDEVVPRTLASRLHPGLHFAGEILDADGPTGGYNLHWAFASAHLAAVRMG